jgi:gamma-glutamylcyclotransferase (GGCT)/AIG2-like uncharacterized protein YtfP
VSEAAQLYFAYGSNLNLEGMASRCAGATRLGPATLEGWRLAFRGVADIEPAPGCVVPGGLWRVSDTDIHALDRYEGAPRLYRQCPVEVLTPQGPERAMTYVMCEGSDYLGLPSPGYYKCILEGYRAWGLPVAELERAARAAIEDLDARGVSGYERDGEKRLRAVLDGHPFGTESRR